MRDMGLDSVFYMWMSSFPKKWFWRDCLFSIVGFWGLCQTSDGFSCASLFSIQWFNRGLVQSLFKAAVKLLPATAITSRFWPYLLQSSLIGYGRFTSSSFVFLLGLEPRLLCLSLDFLFFWLSPFVPQSYTYTQIKAWIRSQYYTSALGCQTCFHDPMPFLPYLSLLQKWHQVQTWGWRFIPDSSLFLAHP
jgi:hypothetical protein